MPSQPLSTYVIGLGGTGASTVVHVKKQLIDIYGSIPENISFAVLDTSGNPDLMAVDDVKLEQSEYLHLGRDAYDLIKRADSTNDYPHISSWLLTGNYLRELPRSAFMLDQGSGQFRQFGRLALFSDVMDHARSKVFSLLQRIVNIAKSSSSDMPLSVVIVGSLVGGTGSGLFLDIPHLIRRISEQNNFGTIVQGFFYLPAAFRATLSPSDIERSRPRAFAAMRELARFASEANHQYRYPMYYRGPAAGSDDQLWRAFIDRKLYDVLYLLEGDVTRANRVPLHRGMAPIVANIVASSADENYGAYRRQYLVNLQARTAQLQYETGYKPLVGGIGAYAILLPMQVIIRDWTHRLGMDVLRSVLPSKEIDELGHVLALADDQNMERPEIVSFQAEIERLMTSQAPIADPQDESRSFYPTPFWSQIYRFYLGYLQNPPAIIRRLNSFSAAEWLDILIPSAIEQEAWNLVEATRGVLQGTVSDSVVTSDQRQPRGNPISDWQRIRDEADAFVIRDIGAVESGGNRQGGVYGDALEQFVGFQVKRFQQFLSLYIMVNLNGFGGDVVRNKSGKLGWILGVVNEWRSVFTSVIELLTKASVLSDARHQELEFALENALSQMRVRADEKGFLGIGRNPAINAQEEYIDQVQSYVDFHRSQLAKGAMSRTSKKISAFLDSTIGELKDWAEVLSLGSQSLYSDILSERNRLQSERSHLHRIDCRTIYDLEWEEVRYQAHRERTEALAKTLNTWHWRTSLDVTAQGTLELKLMASLGEGDFRKDRRGNWKEENVALLRGVCYPYFQDAWMKESILSYLVNSDASPAELGKELMTCAEVLLNLSPKESQNGIRSVVIMADVDPDFPEQQRFVKQVCETVAANQGLNSDFGRPINSDDPLRLTLINTYENVLLENTQEYVACQTPYQMLDAQSRRMLHIFPAEIQAVEYEDKLPDMLSQPKRMLSNRVTIALENQSRVKEFFTLLAYQIITPEAAHGISDTDTANFIWLLQAPPVERRESNQLEEWHLTKPDTDPSLLEAMLTYTMMKADVRSFDGNGFYAPIPYDHISQYLLELEVEETAKRLNEDRVASHNTEIRRWLEEAFLPPVNPETGEEELDTWTDDDNSELAVFARFVVRYDVYCRLAVEFKAKLNQLDIKLSEIPSGERYIQDGPRLIEEFDAYSVAVIALAIQTEQLYQAIRERYLRRIGARRR